MGEKLSLLWRGRRQRITSGNNLTDVLTEQTHGTHGWNLKGEVSIVAMRFLEYGILAEARDWFRKLYP